MAALLLAAGTAVGLLALPGVSVAYMWLGVAAYVGLYTVGLKRRHPIGVVLGGSAGSFPVLAGWSVVEPVGAAAVLMAALVFVWTPAHAWALAHVYREDFAAAGVATLPAVAPPERVQRAVWVSALATVGIVALLVPLAGATYAGTALAGSALDGSLSPHAWSFLPAAGLTALAFSRMWAARPSLRGIEAAVDDRWGLPLRRSMEAVAAVARR